MPAEMNEQLSNHFRTELEKVMVTLSPDLSLAEHRIYFAGYIDCLAERSHIPESVREILYSEYAL